MSRPDENALKSDYCAGVLSIKMVADKHGIAKSTLIDMAKRHQWVRQKKPPKKSVQNENGRMVGRTTERENPHPKTSGDNVLNSPSGQNEEEHFNPDEFGISDQQAKFAMLVAQGKNLIEAYRLAGYEGTGNVASAAASRLLRNVKVYRAISWFRNQYQKRYTADLDLLVGQLMSIVQADPNELTQFRRVNCRYCWGENHLYQWRDIEEFDKAAEKASKDGKLAPEYGGLGFVDNAIPNPDCPKCCGEGRGEIHIADTTLLDGDARLLYAGAKYGKFGVEILMEDKGAARRELLKYLATVKKPLPENSEGSANTDLDDEWKRLRNEKLRTEIENLKKGAGGANNQIIIHNSLPMPGVENVD